MWPIFATMTSVLLRPVKSLDPAKTRKDAAAFLKARFDPDHVFLARDEEHEAHRERLVAADSDGTRAGATAQRGDAPAVAWREWCWTEPRAVGDCAFREIRWRFYANGRIAFQAEMENGAGNLKTGNLQGHRIELRTADGWLLGAWKAAFFVRRTSGIRHYPATILDEHPLLPLHFDELAERQAGIHYFT